MDIGYMPSAKKKPRDFASIRCQGRLLTLTLKSLRFEFCLKFILQQLGLEYSYPNVATGDIMEI